MGYEIKVEGNLSQGLAPWLVAMTGTTCDVETHDGDVVMGEIAQVKPYQHGGATFGLAQVDDEGNPVRGGWVKRIKVSEVKKVSTW